MLSSITVRNLGCFDDQDYKVSFSKMNVIVGTNNSGKSTIFKGLNLLRYLTMNNDLRWSTPYYYLHDFTESVYGHDITKKIKIETQYDTPSGSGSRITINQDGVQHRLTLRDGSPYQDITDNEHKQIIKKIHYFSPNRQPVSYRDAVGQSGDNLQKLHPSGSDIKQFLVERWTDQDANWNLAQEWFKKLDPQLTLLKTPLYANAVSLETERNDGNITISINLSFQGSGMQNIATIVSGIIFSPNDSTIIIEEPENYLNSRSIEILVDLFNFAVNELGKQIIIATHSWEIINAYCSDVGEGTNRGNNHVKINPNDFKLTVINEQLGEQKIQDFDLSGKKYSDVRKYFKDLWG